MTQENKNELTFFQKLTAIQYELVASKDKENKFGGFSYRTAEGILKAVKPHLHKHGLFMSIQDDIVTRGEGDQTRFYLETTVSVTDGATYLETKAMARESLSKKGMDDAQVTGAASSYARKYALNGMFGIDDSKQDPDSNHGNEALMAKVDAAISACNTKEEAIEKMQSIKASPACNKAVLKYATDKFNAKFNK